MTSTSVSPDTPIDLTNCDREPIHILGHVQQFGCLLALDSGWKIVRASANAKRYLGQDATVLIGKPVGDVINAFSLDKIRARVQLLDVDDAVERIFGLRMLNDDQGLFNAGIHLSGGHVILEIEPHRSSERRDYTSYVRPMIDRIKQARTVEELCRIAAKQMRALTGFDRVMIYRFAQDESGEVIAEAAGPNVDSFLGLHYPASDIPQQARQLYRRNLLRIISDVGEDPSPILPKVAGDEPPLDLSMSGLRSVSPIHIEYLKNMGVEASLSVSILQRERLWGLFACHHYEPRILPYEIRSAAELFALMFSFVLDQISSDAAHAHSTRTQVLHDQLMAQLAGGQSVKDHVSTIANALKSVIPNDGVAAWIDGEFQSTGGTLGQDEFKGLVTFLNKQGGNRVYATDNLGAVYPPAVDYSDRAAGLLAIPVSRMARDYIVLFRHEIAREVHWAGNPEKPVTLGPHGARLTPRKSFELWKQTVSGYCAPWTDAETGAAEQLRVTLLEVVLRMSDAANQDRIRANERQDLLIAELNHRVRNILNLIRGLINQSANEANSMSDFTETVGGRIHALARAHDQITMHNWSPASLQKLISTELEAYFGSNAERVRITGPDALIVPGAFTTLALVVHELATNSAKHGALSDSSGEIQVEISQTEDNGLILAWRERGGPPVKAPTRRGFGSTIIERSVPFELQGKADIRFEVTGLEADFSIPPAHVHAFEQQEDPAAQQSAKAAPTEREGLAGRSALVVEDNMIIAMDAEEIILGMGAASVTLCAGVKDAFTALDDGSDYSFALLDVSLGHETSEPIASRLEERGIPFAFATGYGEGAALVKRFPSAVVLKKPYREESLIATIRQTLEKKAD